MFQNSANNGLEMFNGESVYEFDKWAVRFRDYMEVIGRNLNDVEKVARLKLALGEATRDLFQKLSAAETATHEMALNALRAKLDTPQRKEFARYKLSLCHQQENETVGAFLKRLDPLVKMTNQNLTKDEVERKICEELRTRLKPCLTNMLRLLGTSKLTELDQFMERAEEVEDAMKSDKGLESPLSLAINMLKSNDRPESSCRNQTGQNWNEDLGPSFRTFLGSDMQQEFIEEPWNGAQQNRNWNSEQEQDERNESNYCSRIKSNGNRQAEERQQNRIDSMNPNRIKTADGRIWAPLDEVIEALQNLSGKQSQ
jgi:hypothetical protein